MSDPNINPDPTADKPQFAVQSKRQTRADLEQQLHADISLLCLLIRDWTAYIDTIDFLTNQPVTPALEQTCREAHDFPCENSPFYRYRIQVQRPTRDTYNYVSQEMPRHVMTRFDLALDFLTETQADADTLRRGLRHCMTQPWRGKHTTKTVGETDYYVDYVEEEGARRNIAIYSHRPSKVFAGPVAHIDFRHATADFCQRRGVRYAVDLHNLVDQLDRDPRQIKWLKRDVRLSAINWDRAEVDRHAFADLSIQDTLDRIRIPRLAQVHLRFTTMLKDRIAVADAYKCEGPAGLD